MKVILVFFRDPFFKIQIEYTDYISRLCAIVLLFEQKKHGSS